MAQSAPAWDDLPSGNEPSSAAASGSQPSAASPPAWDDLPDTPQQAAPPAWDDLPDQPQPKAEGPIRSFVRHAANAVLPGLAGLAGAGGGAEAGMAIGAPLGPVGAMVGGFVGGAAGALGDAYLASKAQDAVKEVVGLDDSAQAALDAKVNPISSGAGDIAGSMVGMNPAAPATMLQRGAGALIGGGIEAGQQAAGKEDWDPAKIAMSAGAFALAPTTNRLGAAAEGVGRRAVGKFIPGRPGVPAPAVDPARASEDDTSPATLNTERSQSLYGKAKSFVTGQKDMLSKGDVAPDIGAALAGDNQPGVEPANAGNPLVRSTPNVPRPVEGNPGEQIPLKSGVEEAAQQQARVQPPNSPPADLSGMQQAPPVTAAVTPEANQTLTLSQGKTHEYDKPAEQARYKEALADPEAMRQFAADEGVSVDEAREIAEANYEPSRTEHVAKAAQAANPNPTPGQIEGDNYQKGHPPGTFAGKKVSIETAAGSTRKSKPGAPVPWEVTSPYHYGDLKGTSAADSTKTKRQGVDIAFDPEGGENHYVVDQKDADTGKFDEHKIFADTTTPDRVRELYNQGFSDDRGPERLGAITKASEDDLKKWLANPAKKTKPYSKTFEEGVQRPVAPQKGEETLTDQNASSDANVTNSSQSIPSDEQAPPDVMERLRALEAADAEPEAAPTRPPVVDAAIQKMHDAGYEKAARVFERLPLEEQIAKAPTVYKIATTGEAPKKDLEVARVPGNRDALKVKMGDKVVEAANKTEAAQKQAAYDGLKAAFDKHVPPEGGEMPEATRARAAALYEDAAQHMMKLKAADKPPEYALAKNARDLVNKKIGPAKFVSEEALLRDPDRAQGPKLAKQTTRIEADKDLRRHPTAEQHEQAAPDLEETPDSAEVKNVRGVDDLPVQKPAYDMSKLADREKIADALLKAGKDTKQMGHNNGPPFEESVSDRMKRQREARLAAQAAGEKPLPAKYQYGKAAEKASAKDATAEAKAAEAAKRSNIDKAAKKKGVVKDLYDHFMEDTAGKGLAGAEGAGDMLSDVRDYWNKKVPKWSFARDASSATEETGREINKDLSQLGKDSTNTKYSLMDWANNRPDALKSAEARDRVDAAWERNDLSSLDPKEEVAFNSYVRPMLDKNSSLYDVIEELAPGLLGPKTLTNHAMRITKGSTADYNILKEGDDPVAGNKLDLSTVNTRPKATGLARHFMALESDADGKRFVIGLNKDGYTVHVDGKATRIKDPGFEFKEGEKYKVGNDTYTMKQAMKDEIEANARFEDGKRVKYYHDIIFSAGVAHQELSDLARGLVEMERMKKQLQEYGMAAPRGHAAQDGWKTTKLPNFDGWKMHPQIADVLDDFAKPGLNDSALDMVRRVNTALAKTLFWNPIPHMLNELTHAFVARGYRWGMPQKYVTLAQTSAKALMSVIKQDELQANLATNHASLIYRPLRMHDFIDNFGKALGHEIESNPSKWDPIAKKFGVGPSDLVKAIYNNSSKILWAAHDVMITQGVLEREAEGMSRGDAIVDLERHMPNYTVPAQVMGGGAGGRVISKILREKSLFMFGPYHQGVWNSYANIFKDVVHGNGREKAEAAGHIVALAALGGIFYEMDKVARMITGNPDATQQRRGPYAVPSHIAAALRGEEDPTSFARSTFTLAPATTAAFELLTGGKDYNGKAIVDPGTLSKAAHGSPKAAAKAVGQAGDWAARSTISPYSTVSNAWHKGEKPGRAMADQLLDEKNPSPAARKWLHQLPKRNAQGERSRERHPAGLIESTVNKLVGH